VLALLAEEGEGVGIATDEADATAGVQTEAREGAGSYLQG